MANLFFLCHHRIHERWQKAGGEIKKGDELGYFQFGGSSIIVAFRKGRLEFDRDLIDLSRQKVQISVEVGMRIGRAGTSAPPNTYADAVSSR